MNRPLCFKCLKLKKNAYMLRSYIQGSSAKFPIAFDVVCTVLYIAMCR